MAGRACGGGFCLLRVVPGVPARRHPEGRNCPILFMESQLEAACLYHQPIVMPTRHHADHEPVYVAWYIKMFKLWSFEYSAFSSQVCAMAVVLQRSA